MSDFENEVAIAERRWANKQALANASIEGHVPSAAFLEDCEAMIQGTMTTEEAGARCVARALAAKKNGDRAQLVNLQTKKASES